MRTYMKQWVAMLLAFCILVGATMPTVFANVAEDGSEEPALNSVTYNLSSWYSEFGANTYIFQSGAATNDGLVINNAYDAGTSNWKIETGTIKQARLMSGFLRLDTGAANTGEMTYFAIRIQSPGEGYYKLNYDYTKCNYASSPEMDYGNVFILPAPSAAYTKNTIADAVSGKTPALELSYHNDGAASSAATGFNAVSEGYYKFEENKEYIIVFGGKEVDAPTTESNAFMYLRSFTLDEVAVEAPSDEPVVYSFYQDAWKNTKMREQIPGIKEAYDNGESNWRYEMANSGYQFRMEGDANNTAANKTGANVFGGGTRSMTYATVANTWIAVRFQSPGAGRYDLTLTHGALSNGAKVANAYIVPASGIDEKLGENAEAYAAAIAENAYQENGQTDAFKALKAAVEESMKDAKTVITYDCFNASSISGRTATGSFVFEADQEYVLILKAVTKSDSHSSNAYVLAESLTAVYSEDQSVEEEPEGGEEEEETFTKGLYEFYQDDWAGTPVRDKIQPLKTAYDANTMNWRIQAVSISYQFRQAGDKDANGVEVSGVGNNTFRSNIRSLQYMTNEGHWIAVRIQSPGEGVYDLTFTHGTDNRGASEATVYVLDAASIDAILGEKAEEYENAFAADPFQANGSTTVFQSLKSAVDRTSGKKQPVISLSYYSASNGSATDTGRYKFEADKEYVILFKADTKSPDNTYANIYLTSLATKLSDDQTWEEEGGEVVDPNTTYYEFYQYDYVGHYLSHFREEGDPQLNGKQIYSDEIAERYDELKWKYQPSSGYAIFTDGKPYVTVYTSERNYYALRFKAPGTGTYEIDFNYYLSTQTAAAPEGDIYIIPMPAGKEYDVATLKSVADLKVPIATIDYRGDKVEAANITFTYTAFQEGQEYLLVFGVCDDDSTKNTSYRHYISYMSMVRTGEYKPEAGDEVEDGIVYDLAPSKYDGKYLWYSSKENVRNEVQNAFYNGTSNWMLEQISGSVQFGVGYLMAGAGKEGEYVGFRIKSPGTGEYKVTTKYLLKNDPRAADSVDVLIIEAPEEQYESYNNMRDSLARAPIATYNAKYNGKGMPVKSVSGTYMFEEGKEYIIAFCFNDADDVKNTSGTAYIYLDKLVLKRIGDYVEPADTMKGAVVVQDALKELKSGAFGALLTVNDQDYIAIPLYGGTVLIYNLDEWRLVDELSSSVNNPRGTLADSNGNIWIAGDAYHLYKYNLATMEGHKTAPVSVSTGSFYTLNEGEDGYIYMSTNRGHIVRMNPATEEFKLVCQPLGADGSNIGAVVQKGDYIYCVITQGTSTKLVIKVNKHTGNVVGRIDVTEQMGIARYINDIQFIDDTRFAVAISNALGGLIVVESETMTLVTAEEFGLDGSIVRAISEEHNGKYYFTIGNHGLAEYDPVTRKATALGGELVGISGLRMTGQNFATIDNGMQKGECIVTYGGLTAITCLNINNKTVNHLEGLVDTSFYGNGAQVRTIMAGQPGSGEVMYGVYDEHEVQVYDINNNEIARRISTFGSQSDAMMYYKDALYVGNYNICSLTQVIDGKSVSLFRLNDDIFDQARIHTISAGDDKIFVGTVADLYQYAGMVAWYDLETDLTYVVTGPNPEDVVYAKTSRLMATPADNWYNAVTHEPADFASMYDIDYSGDGVKDRLEGPVNQQGICAVYYRDGLLYIGTTIYGGTNTSVDKTKCAKIYVYDVEQLKIVAELDLRKHISGMSNCVQFISGLEGDPDVSNKFWAVFSETLISFTYDRDTRKFQVTEEVSFDKNTYWAGASRSWFERPILFDGEDIIVCFNRRGGLCRINRNDTSQVEQLLSNFNNTNEIPLQYAIGDDGDLYYTTGGPNLWVLNLHVTDEEQADAKVVEDMIDIVDKKEFTLDDLAAVYAARGAYDALAPATRCLVYNYDALVDAEIKMMICRLDAFGEVTIDKAELLESIRADYNAMTNAQRGKVTNSRILIVAEGEMSPLKIKRVEETIAALGEITMEKLEQVRAARALFQKLTRYEQGKVANQDVLNLAEATLIRLQLDEADAKKTMGLIDDIGFVFFGDGAKISLARKTYDALSDTVKAQITNYGTLQAAEVILVVEYVLAVALVAGAAVVCIVPKYRNKVFKKKEEFAE